MQTKSDAQLLREYAEHGAEPAFSELVARHTNLVYSAAARQMDSPDLAAEISQSVFIGLARGARTLSPRLAEDASLAGWLCRSARNLSLNHRRNEFRQHSRERQVMENLDPNPETAPDWEHLRPVLDEAMSELSEPDYDALVMRFFRNQDLRSVGQALGVTEDTAQKRVSRALDKLRERLSRRGISSTATAISIALSANAVSAAPAGLAATISTAAAAISTSTVIAATQAIAMTTLQKILITGTIAAAIGAGIFETRQNSILRDQVQTLRQQQSPLTEQMRQLQRERDAAVNRFASLSDEIAGMKTNSAEIMRLRAQVTRLNSVNATLASTEKDPLPSAAKSWADRVAQLKQRLELTPGAAIPEFKYLTDDNWLNAARNPLNTEEDFRRALASLRGAGENQFIISMQKALEDYLKQNSGQFPTSLSQLKDYFKDGADDTMLERYAIVPASSIPNMKMGGDWLITVKSPVDMENDTLWALGPRGFGSTTYAGTPEAGMLAPVLKAYADANNGQDPKDPSDLLPYLTTPEQKAAFQKLERLRNANAK